VSNRSVLAILNSRAGRIYEEKIGRELRTVADSLGVRCDIIHARSLGQIVRAARKGATSDYDLVVAGGGDGTINAVAGELSGSGKPLGLLPLGTFNYFARELGFPEDAGEAFRLCLEGEIRNVAVGEVNGRTFLVNASVGLYPILLSIREHVYRRWGRSKLVAYWSVLQALPRRRLNLTLTITAGGERRTFKTPLLFVARSALQLKDFRVPGISCVSEDNFSVYILRPMGRLGLVRLLWRAMTHKLERKNDFEMLCLPELRVESSRILRTVAFDGERAKMLAPLEFRVRRNALAVVVPRHREQEKVA
jgi:diacylglycerol kinase family enzyme